VDVVVPQNLSTAVNYACLECVTYALATQLVVTVPGPLSDAATQELAAIWAELQEFGQQIEGVPLAELRDRLSDFETRILDVVRPEDTETPEGTGTATPTSGAPRSGPSATTSRPPTATTSGSSAPAATSTGTATSPSATPTSDAPATESTPAAGTADSTAPTLTG
jgi:putative peptide zinc metalloprotease protein